MKIYLCGPATGLEDYNKPAFAETKRRLLELQRVAPGSFGLTDDMEIFNPTDNGIPSEEPWEVHMKTDLCAAITANMIVVLDNWWRSRGATLEVSLARKVGVPLMRLQQERDSCGSYDVLYPLPELTDKEFGEMPLEVWWMMENEREFKMAVKKAIEYGAKGEDLVAIGRQMADIGEKGTPKGAQSPQAFYTELGCFFYNIGKYARAGEAFRHNVMPSDDTLLDAIIYARMQQRTRHSGYWG